MRSSPATVGSAVIGALLRTLALFALLSVISTRADQLTQGFASPPPSDRPETWFHLIGGNISRAGLTADLEAIHAAGIAGIQLFHGQFGGPWPGVEPQIRCLSPQWDQMIRHVANECARLHLRFAMENCPGWSMAGGPWIKPPDAMRELIWSRTDVKGGARVVVKLPQPQPSNESWRDYHDIAVLAFPTPLGDSPTPLVPQVVHCNHAESSWAALFDPTQKGTVRVAPTDSPVRVEVEFAHAVTLRSLELPPVVQFTLQHDWDPTVTVRVEAFKSGRWVGLARRRIPRGHWQEDHPLTLALPEATARRFRLTLTTRRPLRFDFLRLWSAARVDNWEAKAGFSQRSLGDAPAPKQQRAAWVQPGQIIDLSSNVASDGTLTWTPPSSGSWTILRFGHVNTGARNGPAPPEATGFECNKLNAAAATKHFNGYIGRISAAGGPAGDKLNGMVLDSWECHTQTWTPGMEQAFARHCGYALRRWLPALTGRVVGNFDLSERFLRDWRATINDLLVQNFFGTMATLAHRRGLMISFETAVGDGQPGDILQYFSKADVPMCEFWQPDDPQGGGRGTKPMMPCISAAHIYGKLRIAAESFTSVNLRWNEYPGMLKPFADYNLALGLNHLIFHTYTHNPRLGVVPGTSFGAGIGTPFLRGQTWWKYMPAFTEYLTRCQYLLTQGRPVADVLWYLGDELDSHPREDAPFPAGYRFDYCNQDVLLHRLSVANGRLQTPEGLTWRVLWLRHCVRLTPTTLRRLQQLIRAGATVVGAPPRASATLSGGVAGDREFHKLVSALWGENAVRGDRHLGQGRLLWGISLKQALTQLRIQPDLAGAGAASWCHRHSDFGEIYFIAAPKQPLRASLHFRAKGRPQRLDPLTGKVEDLAVFQSDDSGTFIPMSLPTAGSTFIVFRTGVPAHAIARVMRYASAAGSAGEGQTVVDAVRERQRVQSYTPSAFAPCALRKGGAQLVAWENGRYEIDRNDGDKQEVNISGTQTIRLTGPWMLAFPAGWGTPRRIQLTTLKPWSQLTPEAVRYFSGSATYTTTVTLPGVKADQAYLLDLGRVANMADVRVNGRHAGFVWTSPWRLDISPYIVRGTNQIEIMVTNPWRNRLIYDASRPVAERKTWTIAGPPAHATPDPAGLIGPVSLHVGVMRRLE